MGSKDTLHHMILLLVLPLLYTRLGQGVVLYLEGLPLHRFFLFIKLAPLALRLALALCRQVAGLPANKALLNLPGLEDNLCGQKGERWERRESQVGATY